jgi:hypothetical protein
MLKIAGPGYSIQDNGVLIEAFDFASQRYPVIK